jgi:hypothetical protein
VGTIVVYLNSAPPRFWTNSSFAATIMPLTPIGMPAHATACQLCAGTPGANVAAFTCTVGTFQLMSPISLEAEPTRPTFIGWISFCDPMGVVGLMSVARIFSAKACSSGE